MAQVIHATEKLSNDEVLKLKGKFLDDSAYDTLISSDCDCFKEDGSILFKFRKSIHEKDECEIAFLAFKNLAKATRGRGAAAGPIDVDSIYWKKKQGVIINKSGNSASYETKNKDGTMSLSSMRVQNLVATNIIGYWSESKQLSYDYPCRLSHYSKTEFMKCEDGQPFIEKIGKSYQSLHPEMYRIQMDQAQIMPEMTLGTTPFSTITINRNFRTAVHQDAGDFGFGNLSVIEYGYYHGGYYVIPKYRIAIDMKSGDHLCVDVHEFHSNTEMYETAEDRSKNDEMPDIFNDNLEVGVVGLNNRFARISLVCYLRDKLKECKKEIAPEFITPEMPPDSKVSVMFINPENHSEQRVKFYSTNWSRIPTETYGLMRMVRLQMKNVIIICDESIFLGKKIPCSRMFAPGERDGITCLTGSASKTAYFCPTWQIALKLLNKEVVEKYVHKEMLFH